MCPENKGYISVRHQVDKKVQGRLLLANFSEIYALFGEESQCLDGCFIFCSS